MYGHKDTLRVTCTRIPNHTLSSYLLSSYYHTSLPRSPDTHPCSMPSSPSPTSPDFFHHQQGGTIPSSTTTPVFSPIIFVLPALSRKAKISHWFFWLLRVFDSSKPSLTVGARVDTDRYISITNRRAVLQPHCNFMTWK